MRMERLELSKQKLLGPKSSASTNFATSANIVLSNKIYKLRFIFSLIIRKFQIFLIYG